MNHILKVYQTALNHRKKPSITHDHSDIFVNLLFKQSIMEVDMKVQSHVGIAHLIIEQHLLHE